LKLAINKGVNQLGQAPNKFYPGATVAPLGAGTQSALAQSSGVAKSQAGVGQTGLDYLKFAQGQGLDVANNPYVQGQIQAATQPIMDQLRNDILPSIRTSGVSSAGAGGSRNQLAQGNAISQSAEAAMRTAAGIQGDAYGQGLNTFNNLAGLLPAIQQMHGTPLQTLDTAGTREQAYNQDLINASRDRYDFNQNAPYEQLAKYSQLFSMLGGQGSSTTQPGPTQNRLLSGLGGAGMGAGLAAAVPALGPYGLPLAIGGGLLGAFG
jgi:hypothetical protein